VWARSKDRLSWQACHTACFRRLGGAPAVLRIDNVKTGVSKGAGAWGEVNPACRRYAGRLKVHVDACQPRQPQAKGKVERCIGDQRGADDPYAQVFDSLEALQAWTDARVEDRAHHLSCAATGTSVAEAWEIERALLTPLPETLPFGGRSFHRKDRCFRLTFRHRRAPAGGHRLHGELRGAALQRAVPLRPPGGRGPRPRRAGADPEGLRGDRRPSPHRLRATSVAKKPAARS
jgi:hypothetical protein